MGFPCRSIPNSPLVLDARLSTVLAPWVSAILHAARRKRRWPERTACSLCGHNIMWTEIARLRDRRYGGPAVIRGGAQILI